MKKQDVRFCTINTLQEYLSLDASGLAGTELLCPVCQRIHRIPIQQIRTDTDLRSSIIPTLAELFGEIPTKILAIYDRAIEDYVYDRILDPFRSASLQFATLPLGRKGKLLEATIELGDWAAQQIPEDTQLLIGIGSGVISDVTKWVADKVAKPFVLFATAPSMNAHTSVTASMTENGVKRTRHLDPAKAVLFDLTILAETPLDMRQAGVGDLVARAICNADWKLSNHLRGTYFCSVPYELTARHEEKYLQAAAGIQTGDVGAIAALSEAILVSGISMTMLAGETSPSSGTEHVFSHFWDLQVELEGAPKNLHGIQVAIGTILAFSLYQYMLELDPSKLEARRIAQQRVSLDQIEDENQKYYGEKAYLFNQAVRSKWIQQSEFAGYIENIINSWGELWNMTHPYIGNAAEISSALESVGVELSLRTIKRTKDQAKAALLHGNRYRPRYTILDLAWELGIFPDAADEVLERSGLLS